MTTTTPGAVTGRGSRRLAGKAEDEMAIAWTIEGIEISGVGEDGRGCYAVLIVPGIDGNFADVYGETYEEARQNAEAVIGASKAMEQVAVLEAELAACRAGELTLSELGIDYKVIKSAAAALAALMLMENLKGVARDAELVALYRKPYEVLNNAGNIIAESQQ